MRGKKDPAFYSYFLKRTKEDYCAYCRGFKTKPWGCGNVVAEEGTCITHGIQRNRHDEPCKDFDDWTGGG